jgi:Tol biopolymer transport system component
LHLRSTYLPFASILAGILTGANAEAQSTVRVSLDANGGQGDADSGRARVSADGRYVAFASQSSSFVPGDNNGRFDIFVKDRMTGAIERVSVATGGAEANGSSEHPAISADGQFVAFMSDAENLTPSDLNHAMDIFVHDRLTGITTCASVNVNGGTSSYESIHPSISADGRWVAYQSLGTDIVPGRVGNGYEAFIFDRLNGTNEVASLTWNGSRSQTDVWFPRISADGRFVAFQGRGVDLVPNDTNPFDDIYVRDRSALTTTRASLDAAGAEAYGSSMTPSLSADGTLVVFRSFSTALVPGDTNVASDIFLKNRITGAIDRINFGIAGAQASDHSDEPSIAASGAFAVFKSRATNLALNDLNGKPDVFSVEIASRSVHRASLSDLGREVGSESRLPDVTNDGQFVVFESPASDLVAGDTNPHVDIFARGGVHGDPAARDSVILAGDILPQVGSPVHLSWYSAPKGAEYWLLVSPSGSGSQLFGHVFGIGPNLRVLDSGRCSSGGTGEFATPPLPAAWRTRPIYFELAVRDASGSIHDSNLLERFVF